MALLYFCSRQLLFWSENFFHGTVCMASWWRLEMLAEGSLGSWSEVSVEIKRWGKAGSPPDQHSVFPNLSRIFIKHLKILPFIIGLPSDSEAPAPSASSRHPPAETGNPRGKLCCSLLFLEKLEAVQFLLRWLKDRWGYNQRIIAWSIKSDLRAGFPFSIGYYSLLRQMTPDLFLIPLSGHRTWSSKRHSFTISTLIAVVHYFSAIFLGKMFPSAPNLIDFFNDLVIALVLDSLTLFAASEK